MAESADLRRAIRSAVGAEPEPTPEPSRRPWLGLVTAAAIVALLVAIVPAANLLRTEGDSAASDTTISDKSRDAAAAATTAPAATEAPLAEMAPATEAPATTVAATEAPSADTEGAVEDDGAAFSVLPTSRLRFDSVDELEQLLAEVVAGIEGDGLTRSLRDSEFFYFQDNLAVTPDEAPVSCPATAALDAVPGGNSVVTVGIGEVDGAEILIVVVATVDQELTAVALDAVTCEFVALMER